MFDTKTCKIMIGAGNNRAFKRVCELLGRPELADDPRFKTNGDRQNNREAHEVLSVKVAEVDGVSFSLELLKVGLPCGPVLDTKQVLEGEHVMARGSIIEQDWYRGIHTPVRLLRTPAGLHDACLGLDETGLLKRTSGLVNVRERWTPLLGRAQISHLDPDERTIA